MFKMKTRQTPFFLIYSLGILTVFSGFVNTSSSKTYYYKKGLFTAIPEKYQDSIIRKNSLTWSASGYTKVNKDQSIITLKENARFQCSKFNLFADELVINKNLKIVYAKNFSLKKVGIDSLIKGTFGEFSFKN